LLFFFVFAAFASPIAAIMPRCFRITPYFRHYWIRFRHFDIALPLFAPPPPLRLFFARFTPLMPLTPMAQIFSIYFSRH